VSLRVGLRFDTSGAGAGGNHCSRYRLVLLVQYNSGD
jgi:hypothetical protein